MKDIGKVCQPEVLQALHALKLRCSLDQHNTKQRFLGFAVSLT